MAGGVVHRVYLGAAPGVGKTFAMLNEGARRKARGDDVVIAWFQEHGRAETTAKTEGLERVPPLRLTHRGSVFEEMDVDAVLERRPQVALVDELAHTNVPGARNEKRWQDVEELLAAGISVISTMNIQHLESVNDVIERITGVQQAEKIPDEVVRRADQIELVDLTPEALRRRLERGDVYAEEKIDAALRNYFRPGNLAALRELALLWVAEQVEEGLEGYMEAHGISEPWETRERVVVALSGRAGDDALVRRAARIAARGRGELIAVHVLGGEGLASASDPETLEQLRALTEALGGSYHELAGGEVAVSLLEFARTERATQLVLGASSRSRLAEFLRGSVINAVNRGSGPIDVHIISEVRGERAEGPKVDPPSRGPTATPRQRAQAFALMIVGLPVLTALMVPLRDEVGLASVALIYMALIVGIALRGGVGIAVIAALLGALLLNFFFTEPLHTLRVSDTDVLVSVILFVLLASLVGAIIGRLGRRSLEAGRARREAQALAFTAGAGDEGLEELVEAVRVGFGLNGVKLSERQGGELVTVATSGNAGEAEPDETIEIDSGRTQLALAGRPLSADDRRVLSVLTRQFASALERRRLKGEASAAELLAESDRFRTAVLRAVSHDLRTPLASIKASVSGLLHRGAALEAEDSKELLRSIDTSADTLDRLVGNLLDMSRLEAGILRPRITPVGLDEVVPVALEGVDASEAVEVVVPEGLPRVLVDPGLLERALSNVIANALRAAGPDRSQVRLEGTSAGDEVVLRVVDRGPGLAVEEREKALAPFQRFDDSSGGGLGLGLAIAHGFVTAMGGRLEFEETPGGGLTLVMVLAAEQESAGRARPTDGRA